jgi:AraC family transcriptional regulator
MNSSFIRFIHAGDVTVKADHRLMPRKLADYELVYFPVPGQTVYEVEGTRHTLDSSSFLVTRPGELHSYRFDSDKPTRHLYAHFDLETDMLLDRYPLLKPDHAAVFKLSEYSLIPQLMKQLFYALFHKPNRWRMFAEVHFMTMLEELESDLDAGMKSVEKRQLPVQITQSMQYMDAHIKENVSVELLARQAGWSHEYFTRQFHRHTGQSPKDWMLGRKLESAGQELLHSTDSIKQIARNFGFADEYYFHRLFRKRMGMTAKEYRSRYGTPRLLGLTRPDDSESLYPHNSVVRLNRADAEDKT